MTYARGTDKRELFILITMRKRVILRVTNKVTGIDDTFEPSDDVDCEVTDTRDMAFTLAFATLWAWMEVEMEGKHGWAINLPTSCAFYGWTWYHVSMNLIVLLVMFYSLQYANFARWYYKLSYYVLYVTAWFVVEDIMWFVLNPHYGIRKYTPNDIFWHANKVWFLGTFLENWLVLGAWGAMIVWEMYHRRSAHFLCNFCAMTAYVGAALVWSVTTPEHYTNPIVFNTGCFLRPKK